MSGDKKFEQLYRRFHPSLVSFAAYLTGSSEDAAELVNDVFFSVWQKKEKLAIDESLKSYLYAAVKNRSINFQKKKKMKIVEILPHDRESALTADGQITQKETDDKLQFILSDLPPKCKQVFVMSRFDELKNKEIATLLDISVKTVENQMTKAFKIVKEKWKIE